MTVPKGFILWKIFLLFKFKENFNLKPGVSLFSLGVSYFVLLRGMQNLLWHPFVLEYSKWKLIFWQSNLIFRGLCFNTSLMFGVTWTIFSALKKEQKNMLIAQWGSSCRTKGILRFSTVKKTRDFTIDMSHRSKETGSVGKTSILYHTMCVMHFTHSLLLNLFG